MPNSSIKNEKMYEDLRKQGDSKEKAARISNAAAARGKSAVGRKGGKSGSYDDWTVAELKKRAEPGNDVSATAATVDVIIGPTLDDNGVHWRVRARTSQYPIVQVAPLRASLAGREFTEAEDVVKVQGLALVRIEVWPWWWPRLPFFDSRLRISVDTATSATSASP